MLQSCPSAKWFLGLALLALVLSGVPATAAGGDFTLGLKAWDASLSGGGDDLHFPGFYASYAFTEHLWISSGFIDGEVESVGTTVEEEDFDLIIGWSFSWVDIGAGYRRAKFTTSIFGFSFPIDSAGPMVYLGGGHLWRHWGFYFGVAIMPEDLEDDDGSQSHINGEGGIRWDPGGKNFTVLFGYRYKDYSGDGIASDTTFDGPVVNIAYTWR